MAVIFEYLDYRKFLVDRIAEKRATSMAFSQRAILQQLGIKSSGYLANVLAGRSSLSVDQATPLGRILGLSGGEVEYFRNLILFEHAKTVGEKNDFFDKLLASRRLSVKLLSQSEHSLFEKWYFIPVRELMTFHDFKDDWHALGEKLEPQVSGKDVAEAVKALVEGDFVKRNEDGKWVSTDPAITTGDDIRSFMVMRYQKDMLTLAERALSKLPADEREVGGVTFSVSTDKLLLVKEEVRRFRRRLLQIASDDMDSDRVFRCSIQVFPLSRPLGKKK